MRNDNLSIAFNFENKFNFKWNFNSRLTKIFNVEYQKVSGTQMVWNPNFPARVVGPEVGLEESARMRERADKLAGGAFTRGETTVQIVASRDT